jgi:threonine dehydrogenase-like Zn-dependent dehydrogenase
LQRIGAIAIDFKRVSSRASTNSPTVGKAERANVNQCCDKHKEHSNATMNELVQAVKATGSIGVVGVFVPKDPKSKEELKKAKDFDFGQFWMKGQRIKQQGRQMSNPITVSFLP